MRTIDSEKNTLYKNMLQQGRSHIYKKSGLILIEGIRQVEEALSANYILEYLVFSDDIKGLTVKELMEQKFTELMLQIDPDKLILMKTDLFRRLAVSKTPQGVIAVLKYNNKKMSELKNENCLVLLDVQDPGNVGTLIRSADAFKLKQVLILGATASPFTEKAIRAAMGSIFHLDIFVEADSLTALELLQDRGFELLALDISGYDLRQLRRSKTNFALILGNEGNGLAEDVLILADQNIRIEMPGSAESLNVAMAGSIALYELSRQEM